MQFSINLCKNKQLYITLILFISSFLLTSENLFAYRDELREAKTYNYLKADLLVDSSNEVANGAGQDDDINAVIKSTLLNYVSDKLTPSPNEDIDLYSGTLKLHEVRHQL